MLSRFGTSASDLAKRTFTFHLVYAFVLDRPVLAKIVIVQFVSIKRLEFDLLSDPAMGKYRVLGITSDYLVCVFIAFIRRCVEQPAWRHCEHFLVEQCVDGIESDKKELEIEYGD